MRCGRSLLSLRWSRHCHAVQWDNIEQSTSVRLASYTVCSFICWTYGSYRIFSVGISSSVLEHRLSVYRSCDVRMGRSVQYVSMANCSLHKLILKLIPQDKRPSMQCSPNTTLFQLSVFVPLSLPPVALPTNPAFPCPPQQTPVRCESVRSTACVLHVWV